MTVERTALGQRALVERTGTLSQRQRSALFLVDGKRDLDDLAQLAAAAGVSRSDLDSLFTLGLLRSAPPPASVPASSHGTLSKSRYRAAGDRGRVLQSAEPATHGGRSLEERFTDAYPVACRLTSELGLAGMFLNLQVKAVRNHAQLAALTPKIREAVGDKKFSALDMALNNWTRVS